MLFKTNAQKIIGFLFTLMLLLICMGLSIVYGYSDTSFKTAIHAFTHFNGSNEHIIIESVRLPRALIATAVGSSLAITGVLMQTLTKNPLASPGILGINAGAGFAVVLSVTFIHSASLQTFTWIAFLGAAISAILVYMIGTNGGNNSSPMQLTLAGAALSALFASFTQGLLATNEAGFDQVLFWLSGSVQGRSLDILSAVFPYLLIGWLASLVISAKMNVLAMGDDVTKGLGIKLGFLKLTIAIIVILLAGGSVSIAGPIGFIGIVIPHIARKMIGIDHRWLIPYSGLLGGILLLVADIAARYIIMPREIPVGVMTALIGTPFFIVIARRGFNK
ncbi:FecCD family ABC transporter permease [Bacillus testis]|uniref:FecCD family ABC transporter permease n=1 Tax=Bacillus testis TaxID=1622072 RepID=UPI00067E9EEB|nr:iron ABC transporter permease [Bacillus testis]